MVVVILKYCINIWEGCEFGGVKFRKGMFCCCRKCISVRDSKIKMFYIKLVCKFISNFVNKGMINYYLVVIELILLLV